MGLPFESHGHMWWLLPWPGERFWRLGPGRGDSEPLLGRTLACVGAAADGPLWRLQVGLCPVAGPQGLQAAVPQSQPGFPGAAEGTPGLRLMVSEDLLFCYKICGFAASSPASSKFINLN